MINLVQLGVFLPQGHLFKDVSLQINRGDKIGLTGKNGAGKFKQIAPPSAVVTIFTACSEKIAISVSLPVRILFL